MFKQILPDIIIDYIMEFNNPYKEYFKNNVLYQIDPTLIFIDNGCESCYIRKLKNINEKCTSCRIYKIPSNKNPKKISIYYLYDKTQYTKFAYALLDIKRFKTILSIPTVFGLSYLGPLHYEIKRGPKYYNVDNITIKIKNS
jgi:hypothetical protein